jgi:hypothetical protein
MRVGLGQRVVFTRSGSSIYPGPLWQTHLWMY